MAVILEHNGQQVNMVIAGSGPNLIGQDWLMRIKLDWSQLHRVHLSISNDADRLAAVLEKHQQLFTLVCHKHA